MQLCETFGARDLLGRGGRFSKFGELKTAANQWTEIVFERLMTPQHRAAELRRDEILPRATLEVAIDCKMIFFASLGTNPARVRR